MGCRARTRLGHVLPPRKAEGRAFDLRRAKACYIDVHRLQRRMSLVSELRADSHFAGEPLDGVSKPEAGTPRSLRRVLRRIRHYEKLESDGVDVGSEGRRLLRRKPGLQAALARSARPAAGVSPQSPLRAAARPIDFEGDVVEFRRRMLKEFSGLMDFHLRPEDGSVVKRDAGAIMPDWLRAFQGVRDEVTDCVGNLAARVEGLERTLVVEVHAVMKSEVAKAIQVIQVTGSEQNKDMRVQLQGRFDSLMSKATSASDVIRSASQVDHRERDLAASVGRCEQLLAGMLYEAAPRHCGQAAKGARKDSAAPVELIARVAWRTLSQVWSRIRSGRGHAAGGRKCEEAVTANREPGSMDEWAPGSSADRFEAMTNQELIGCISRAGLPVPRRQRTRALSEVSARNAAEQYRASLIQAAARAPEDYSATNRSKFEFVHGSRVDSE